MCCDQTSAILFSGLQTLSGGVPGIEDFLPAYCLHHTMTFPHEVEVEAAVEVEGETVAEGEVDGGEFQVEHKRQHRHQEKLSVRPAQWGSRGLQTTPSRASPRAEAF